MKKASATTLLFKWICLFGGVNEKQQKNTIKMHSKADRLNEKQQNTVAPTTTMVLTWLLQVYWWLEAKRVRLILSSWSFARFVCLHYRVCRLCRGSSVCAFFSLHPASFQSKPITMFRFAAVSISFGALFFPLSLSLWCGEQSKWTLKTCAFFYRRRSRRHQCCALLAVYANDMVDQLRWRQTTTI